MSEGPLYAGATGSTLLVVILDRVNLVQPSDGPDLVE